MEIITSGYGGNTQITSGFGGLPYLYPFRRLTLKFKRLLLFGSTFKIIHLFGSTFKIIHLKESKFKRSVINSSSLKNIKLQRI